MPIKFEPCTECQKTGIIQPQKIKCPVCNGKGEIQTEITLAEMVEIVKGGAFF